MKRAIDTSQYARVIFALLAIYTLVYFGFFILRWYWIESLAYPDFTGLYEEALMVRQRVSPYFPATVETFSSYASQPPRLPPMFYILYIPFTFFPTHVGVFLWSVFNVTALGVTVYLLMRALWGGLSWEWIGLTCLILLSSKTLLKAQLFAGYNILFLCALATVWLAHHHGRPWLAGIFLGASVIFKPMPLILIPLFLVKRRYQTVVATLVTLLGMIICSLLWLGVPPVVQNLVVIKAFHDWALVMPMNLSAISFVHKLLGEAHPSLAYGLGAGAMLVLYVVSLIVCARQDEPLSVGQYALVVPLIPICSPYVIPEHFLLLVFPLLITSHILMRDKPFPEYTWGVFIVTWLVWARMHSFLKLSLHYKGLFLMDNIIRYVPLFTALVLWGLLLSCVGVCPSKNIDR